MKKPEADLTAAVTGISRRLDAVDARLSRVDALAADLSAVGRSLADLTGQVRALNEATNRRILTGLDTHPHTTTPATPTDQPGPEDGQDPHGQPDWLTVTDPVTATGWLTDAHAFTTDVLTPVGLAPGAPCWLLHPSVVVELLALHAEYRACYDGEDPTPVCELLARWLPGAHRRITATLGPCTGDHSHHHGGRLYDAAGLKPAHVARWWADTHGSDPDAVTAFALTPIT